MKECWIPFRVAFATRKNYFLTEKLGQQIRYLVEGGLVNKWIEDTLNSVHKIESSTKKKLGNKEFSLSDLFLAFIILILGWVIAVLGILLEFCLL